VSGPTGLRKLRLPPDPRRREAVGETPGNGSETDLPHPMRMKRWHRGNMVGSVEEGGGKGETADPRARGGAREALA